MHFLKYLSPIHFSSRGLFTLRYFHKISNYMYQDNMREAKINGKSSPEESKSEINF